MKACPVCGEKLGNTDLLNDIIHMSLCFDEGTGNQIMTGGFLTEKQASHGYQFYAFFSQACDSKVYGVKSYVYLRGCF